MQREFLRKIVMVVGLVGAVVYVGGCKKNQPTAAAPTAAPAPAAAEPTVTLNASPASIQPGQSVTLTWSSTNATNVQVGPEVGQVAAEGSTKVSPSSSTTYTVTATGPGGTADASARVTVMVASAPPPTTSQSMDQLFQENVKDIYFDLNKSDVRADARDSLSRDAEFLRSYPQLRVSIEGHCDERGSTEYNLALGQRRAQAGKDYLTSLGIAADRMETVSWGKERPFCTEHTEDCWQSNRRDHFAQVH